MNNIGAKVYRMALNSEASWGDADTHLEWIHSGEEVVKHSDYEIALKRILELEQELSEQKEDTETIHTDYTDAVTKLLDEEEENTLLKEQVRVRAIALADAEYFLTQIDPVHWPDRKAARGLIKVIRDAIANNWKVRDD